ncbi:hypothetical protein F4604DRAFT_1684432 [Suillus subluteus]|nr:hypothetical protein F4604DRAFT_1684432 [Suillus subluteus]
MASVMGRLSENMHSNLDNDTTSRIFSQGLQQMSSEGICRAAYYKEAELEYHRHLSMALVWEVEKLSRLKHFLDCEHQEQEEQTTRAFEEAELSARMVADRDSERASQDIEFVTSLRQQEMTRITQLNTELDELDLFLPNPDTTDTYGDLHDLDTADTHGDQSHVGDCAEDEVATGLRWYYANLFPTFDHLMSCVPIIDRSSLDLTTMSANQNAPSRARRRVVQDVPIIRQSGLNVAGNSSGDQVGCAAEIPESMNTPELPPQIYPPPVFLPIYPTPVPSNDGYSPPIYPPPVPSNDGYSPPIYPPPVPSNDGYSPPIYPPPVPSNDGYSPPIYPPPVFSNDGYSSVPPNFQDMVPLPRTSRFTGEAPRAVGPDQVQRSFTPSGDVASRYRMVYTYLPLRGAEKSRQEYTDGVVFRNETTGIQKSTTRRYQLPPVRPSRESLETTPTATASRPSISSTVAEDLAATGRERHSSGATVPVIDKTVLKTIVKDAKNSIIMEILNKRGFHDSSSRLTIVRKALTDACTSIIFETRSIELWVDNNVSELYKTISTPISTILNRFKQCAQDVIEILYKLQISIWTDLTFQINQNKTTVEFLVSNDSINYIFGEPVRLEDGREFRFPFEHDGVMQIAERAVFRDGYDKFIKSDESLDNIMAISATAACCSLQEFSTGKFKQIDFTYSAFNKILLVCFHQSHEFASEVVSIPLPMDTHRAFSSIAASSGALPDDNMGFLTTEDHWHDEFDHEISHEGDTLVTKAHKHNLARTYLQWKHNDKYHDTDLSMEEAVPMAYIESNPECKACVLIHQRPEEPANVALLRLGLLGCSAVEPSVAIEVHVLTRTKPVSYMVMSTNIP